MEFTQNMTFSGWLNSWIEVHRRNRAYRRTIAALRQRSEQELEDLGFNRGEIPEVAAKATFGK